MRGLVLVTVLLASVAAAQPALGAGDTIGTGAASPGAEAGRSGTHHAGKRKHHAAIKAEAAPGPAQPQGMVGGAGGPSGAACAGGRGDTARAKHRSSNRHQLDPLAEAMGSKRGGVRCVERF